MKNHLPMISRRDPFRIIIRLRPGAVHTQNRIADEKFARITPTWSRAANLSSDPKVVRLLRCRNGLRSPVRQPDVG
jgi:hypothetical protein